MHLNNIRHLIFFVCTFFICTANATALPVKSIKIPKGGLAGAALQVAVSAALMGVDWIMTEGVKTKRTKDVPSDNADSSSASSKNTLPEHASYPLEYISFDGTAFSSAQAAHKHNIEAYMKANNLIKSRDSKGIFFDDLHIYLGHNGYYSSGVGYFVSSVQLASAKNPPKNLIGGSLYRISGQIFYKGSESLESTDVLGDYKAKREAARKAVEAAISEAAASQSIPDIAIDKWEPFSVPSDSTKNPTNTKDPTKPKDKPSDGTKDETKDDAKSDSKSDSKKDTKTDSKKDTKAKEKTDTKFCEWAKWFCDGDTDKQDGSVQVKELPVHSDSVNISFGGSCPASREFGFVVGGHQMAFVLSYEYLCQIAIKMGGIIKMLSTVIAAYILSGIKK